MTVNVPLLRKVVEWVESQELIGPQAGREWYQGTWFGIGLEGWSCGTAMCIAGKLALDDGWTPVNGAIVRKAGTEAAVHVVAARLLGIDPYSDISLFYGSNTAADIRALAEALAGERL